METCYRHEGRETGRHCTRCGKPACHECLKAASVGSHCPDCVRASAPPVAERVRIRIATGPPIVTYALMIANVMAFLLLPGTADARIVDYTLIAAPIDVAGEWYRVLTSAFLHVNLIHIVFNMLVLYQLGGILEPALGWWRFSGVYVIGLLGGSLGALLLSPEVHTLGASGAVYGLMGALFVLSGRRGLDPWRSVGGLIAINLIITVTIPNISLGGHVGGLIAGGLAALALDPARTGWRASTQVGAGIVVAGSSALFAGALFAAQAGTAL